MNDLNQISDKNCVLDKPKRRLRRDQLALSPNVNPLLEPGTVPIKRKQVRSGLRPEPLIYADGEVAATSVIRTIEEKDDAQFVKIFAAGIAASYELTKTGQRVFTKILELYEAEPMTGGFVETIYIAWFGDGLDGRDIGMSKATFDRGLRELLDKKFIAPCRPNVFWVNPSLFFKGNRVLFIKEYVRVRAISNQNRDPKTIDLLTGMSDEEAQNDQI